MTVELRPLGVKCNIQCQYCYQNPLRDAGNTGKGYDLDRMKAAIEAEGGPFALFGGEALLVPAPDLEALWSWGLEKYGSNSVQTNGVLINDEHIRLFKQYQVHVGISIDGPGELNDARWAGSAVRTREATEKSQQAIERLCGEGIPPSLIVTLHRCNAAPDKLPILCEWLRRMEALGVTSARLHLLEINHSAVRSHYALSVEENLAALQAFADLETKLTTLRLDVFNDLRNMLLGRDDATCIWNACDPYTTRAVRGVEGNGQRSNCGRTNKDGIEFVKAAVEGFERYIALYHTPQEHGGCRDCRFFLQCKGQCPGTAIDADWRNRTEHCGVWMELFERMENELLSRGEAPVSASPLRSQFEGHFLSEWAAGRNTTFALARKQAQAAPWNADPQLSILEQQPQTAQGIAGDRLGFEMPDFARIAWVSLKAEQTWSERLRRIQEAWREIEWRSVVEGIRACALLPQDYDGPWAAHGLKALAIGEETGQIVVGGPADALAFLEAWEAGDDAEMGRLLGQPPCCFEFQRRVWTELGLEDDTWPMASESSPASNGAAVEMSGPRQTNALWRWIGVRPVPHQPCCPTCSATIALAEQFAAVGRRAGYQAEMNWMEAILSWPIEWSSLHGIAEIRTPILKTSTRTDPLARVYTVRRHGEQYPAEGANATRFPYRQVRPPLLTLSHGFRRGLENAAALSERPSAAGEAHS